MTQECRAEGGLIDRTMPLDFTFNGHTYTGYAGDTLASALLANGVHLVGRSFKYHRPRGIMTSGSEEPNALVTIKKQGRITPNTRATTVELYHGLAAESQNHWPSIDFDLLEINDKLSNFLTAGFYYKTFMWPASFWERVYEPMIRRAAGLGKLAQMPDPDCYSNGYLHCDLLIIGAGPAGLAAALSAGRAGLRVILADEDYEQGGRLLCERIEIDNQPGAEWARNAVNEIESLKSVRLMRRTTIFGVYDHGIYGALERHTDHLACPLADAPRETLWRIYTKRAILAAGALERPIAFGGNDLPGIMLAGAVRAYVNRYGVLSGKRVAVFTNNNNGAVTADDLRKAGAEVVACIDYRSGAKIRCANGGKRVSSIRLADGKQLRVDCVAVSGGWSPNVNLTCHKRGRPRWCEDISAFVPANTYESEHGMLVAGAANGALSTAAALQEGASAAAAVAGDLGKTGTALNFTTSDNQAYSIKPLWDVGESKRRSWVDFQNDVTTKDIKLAAQEGFQSVEHLKRYTTLGMATDQGKTANLVGLAVMAEITGRSIPETGVTIFRPPYNPVSIGAFAGHGRGEYFKPVRITPSDAFSKEAGAVFVEAGLWMRAQMFPKPGETHWRQTVDREVAATRNSVGVCDVTTLGKIDIQGRDAGEFLNHVYVNAFLKLPVGKCRYGLMLREDGMAMDDGTVARLGETHFIMTTTTANAASVFRHLEFCRQCLWPDLDVQLMSVTENWAQYAVAGPNSRKVLEKIVDRQHDISNEAFPYMACGEIAICGGVRARLFRLSFSGELAYEIAVPARYGDSLIRQLMKAGEEFNIVPYGTEALGVMRIEKGHPAGAELNGQTTAYNLCMEKFVSEKKDCIGKILSQREGLTGADVFRLVGVRPVDPKAVLVAGAHIVKSDAEATLQNDEGHLTSVAFSPELNRHIGLGLIKDGSNRLGEIVSAVNPLGSNAVDVEICSPHFIDSEGERLRV